MQSAPKGAMLLYALFVKAEGEAQRCDGEQGNPIGNAEWRSYAERRHAYLKEPALFAFKGEPNSIARSLHDN